MPKIKKLKKQDLLELIANLSIRVAELERQNRKLKEALSNE